MFGRLFGQLHRDALLIEVESALAGADDWGAVPRESIAAIERKYGATLKDSAQNEAVMLVVRAANALNAQQVIEGGAARLRALAAALGLSAEVDSVVQMRARLALAEAAQHLIADEVLTDDERAAFDQAAKACGFTPDQVASILSDAVARRLKDEIAMAVEDGLLSDVEEARIDALGHALQAQLDLDEPTRATLAEAKRLWQVDHGELPAATSPIALPKSETCLFAGYGQVLEPRTRGKQSFTHSYGAGDIVLTDKRIIFNGGAKNIAVRLNTVVDFRLFDDGVELRKAAGKPLTFALSSKDPWFARLFNRAKQDQAG